MTDIRDAMYLVMDGRANYDVDSAVVLGVYNAKNDDEAKKYFKADWAQYDAVMLKKVGKNLELLFIGGDVPFPLD